MVKRPDQGGCAVSVELLNTPRFYGFRVRRQIDGRTYQEYFSLKAEGKRSVARSGPRLWFAPKPGIKNL